MAEKQFRADFVDVVVETLTFGIMKNINKALRQYGYEGDELLTVETDADGNPINRENWSFRPMNSNRPKPDPPYILVGRVVEWTDDEWGMMQPRQRNAVRRIKSEDELMVSSTTTGAWEDGTMIIDGMTNFEREGITINQYVAKLDENGDEVDNTFTLGIFRPHKVELQDGLFFDTHGGEDYEIYHTTVDSSYRSSGETLIRFATHNERSDKATISAHAIRHYLRTLQANNDLIDVELTNRKEEAGEIPAWAHVSSVGDINDASRLLSEDERSKGVQHRREIQTSLRVAEVLHKHNPALESHLELSVKVNTEGE